MKKLLILATVSLVPMVMAANSTTPQQKQADSQAQKVIQQSESPSHKLINTQIKEIKPPRTGVRAVDVLKTKSPFILLKTGKNGKKTTYAVKKRVKLPPLKLESVINKNVKINGKWYKEGDKVRHYTIMKVSSGKVLLKSKKKELQLFQDQPNDKINFNVN